MEKSQSNSKKNSMIAILFLISCILFAIPSICFYTKYKTVLNYPFEFKFLLTNRISQIWQGIIYFIIILIITIFYILIIKNRRKIFNTNKNVFIFILIISTIFLVVIPVSSSDVFYYLGIGRIDGKYGQNPYYITMKDFVETNDNNKFLQKDSVLKQGYLNVWSPTTVVYGPIWTLICKTISMFSFGNIDFGLLFFKICNLIIHILNCWLIYKITNRKLFTLIYGINPLILIEGIGCVHNDLWLIFFILLSFYCLLKKKNILLSTAMLSVATAIKYVPVILLPFIIIYYFRKEKPSKRLKKCIEYGLWFIFILILCYLLYMRDFGVLQGIATMQTRIAKNFYTIMIKYLGNIPKLTTTINKILLKIFIITYTISCTIMLNKEELKYTKMMKNANRFLLIFLFLLITNFQPWYIMWLFPCLMWQKSDMIKLIIAISIFSQLANTIFFMFTERWTNGIPYTLIFAFCTASFYIINKYLIRKNMYKKSYSKTNNQVV